VPAPAALPVHQSISSCSLKGAHQLRTRESHLHISVYVVEESVHPTFACSAAPGPQLATIAAKHASSTL
jgi:hypothetical protein